MTNQGFERRLLTFFRAANITVLNSDEKNAEAVTSGPFLEKWFTVFVRSGAFYI